MVEYPGAHDPRIRRYVLPKAVVWQTDGAARPEGAENLLTGDDAPCRMKYEDDAPGILVDFGQELHGGIEIRNGITPGHKPIRVRVRFGESVVEAMREPNQDHAIHDQEILVPWYGSAEFGNTGFRYMRIDMAEPGAELEIKRLRAVFLYRDIPYAGSFRCNDTRLNRIWEVGAYTTHLCMQDMLWDGIKRDRLVWIGDMHPETMVINTVFGADDVVPKSLDFVRGQTPLPQWMNGISSYSLWWVRIHRCWYQYHGNKAYLEEQRDYLLPLLEQLLGEIGDDGREKLGGHRFLDWPTSEDPTAIHAGLQALLRMALLDGAALCAVLGETATEKKCRDGAALLGTHTPERSQSKQANALTALAGLENAKAINRGHLAVEPLRGLSTFYGYYVLQARAMAGDYTGCLDVIRNYWGAMLDMGATTFWEDFSLDWVPGSVPIDELVPEGKRSIHADYGAYCYKGLRHSLCHGWASGPTAWLSEHVLGFRPLAPGCRRLRVTPHLAGLEHAEGAFPTPHGPVTVKHHLQPDGAVTSDIDAPDGVEVVLGG